MRDSDSSRDVGTADADPLTTPHAEPLRSDSRIHEGRSTQREHRLRTGRFLRLLAFFARAFSQVLLRDVFLSQVPFLRTLRGDPLPRWVAIARRFRRLAIERGG
ncbi:MAG: hypothetical protein MPN21_08800, partial [Thermoanaerobaculia bacterium]|nr:hypothetical protein [Thermoanaerobaculia bacterium]